MNRYAWVFAAVVLAGCGANFQEGGERSAKVDAPAAPEQGAIKQANEPAIPAAEIVRKIVYNGDLDLVVEDFSPVAERVAAIAARCDGYIAKSQLRGRTGQPRGGVWTVRVPAARFDEALKELTALGEVRKASSTSQDVTAEFYDLEARLRNKKLEESRLLKHLEETTGKLEEILSVEREIARVRGEIEQMQGKLRLLSDLSALSTITVNVDEIRDYKPEPPTFAMRVGRAWSGSLTALVDAAQGLAVLFVGMVPWLGVLSVPGLGGWLIVRRANKRRRTPPPLR